MTAFLQIINVSKTNSRVRQNVGFSQGRRQTYLIINCMSGETSCFYRLFVARLQVFPLFFSLWFVEREVRKENKTKRD